MRWLLLLLSSGCLYTETGPDPQPGLAVSCVIIYTCKDSTETEELDECVPLTDPKGLQATDRQSAACIEEHYCDRIDICSVNCHTTGGLCKLEEL
jgi:hypothetical protein